MTLSATAQFRLSMVGAALTLVGCVASVEKLITDGPSDATILSLIFFPLAAVMAVINAVRVRKQARAAEAAAGSEGNGA